MKNKYPESMIRFVLGEYYELRLPVAAGHRDSVDFNKLFSICKKEYPSLTLDDVYYIPSRWTKTAYNGIQEKNAQVA